MKYNTETVGKIIKSERKKLNLSQKELGEKVGVVGKQISNYEKGLLLPPIDVLLDLCEIFNCELGFLLGEPEYANGTKLDTAFSDYTGLSQESLNNIKLITGTESKCVEFGHQSEAYTAVLNKLLSSKQLIPLIENTLQLESVYAIANGCEWDNIKNEIGETRMTAAMDNYNNPYNPESCDTPPSEEECNDYKLIAEAQERQYEADSSVKIYRYEVWESFNALINELYPRISNTP